MKRYSDIFPGPLYFLPVIWLAWALPACTTPAGKQAKRDATVIQRNAVAAQKSNQAAKDDNASIQASADKVQDLDARIDAKDRVIEQYYREKH